MSLLFVVVLARSFIPNHISVFLPFQCGLLSMINWESLFRPFLGPFLGYLHRSGCLLSVSRGRGELRVLLLRHLPRSPLGGILNLGGGTS